MPKVSICLPNLNTAKYLPERFNSIFAQTFQDWELIVHDSYSDDGAWEYIQHIAAGEPRMQIAQGPREGVYAGFNSCITKAQGEFIYIATSDDTMYPECLEKMVAALEEHPECGLCQCALDLIDENSRLHHCHRWKEFCFGRFAPEWVETRHVRPAPVDGLLHCALQTVYTSITQLLIRKTVFDRYGLFETHWGSVADFEWGMRVGFLESCVYIPEYLATWRKHSEQATSDSETAVARRKMLAMARSAYGKALRHDSSLAERLPPLTQLMEFYEEQIFLLELREYKTRWGRIQFLIRSVLAGNQMALRYLKPPRSSSLSVDSQARRLRSQILDLGVNVP